MKDKFNNFLEDSNKMSIKDYLILGIIVVFYSILSFVNLGSLKNPQTFYQFEKNESIIFKLNKDEDVIKTKIYSGEKSGKYDVYASTDNKTYLYLKELSSSGAFSWNEEKLLVKTKYIKIISKNNSLLGSISFYNNSKNLIEIDEVSSNVKKTNDNLNKLIDEKDMIPENISFMNSTYFDEIYFARTAYDYANNKGAYEWVHPPLGKLIQSLPIRISNTMSPFYYRLMGNIAGILMIVVMYFLSKILFKKRKCAIFGSLLMVFDTFHFAQTRMGTVDSFLVLFIMISYLFMIKYLENHKLKDLVISGITIGLAISVKWTGLYAGLGLCIIFLTHVIKNKLITKKLVLISIVSFIVIPFSIYTSSYLIYPNIQVTTTNSIPKIIEQTKKIYNYHSNLNESHPFSSSWYTWPISYKPVWYYNNEVNDNLKGTIVGIGNVTIWWIGLIAIVYVIIDLVKNKNKEAFIIAITYLVSFIPYAFIGRVMFLYHFFPVLPFMMLAIIYLLKKITEKTKTNIFLYFYTAMVIITFIMYYPVVSGIVVSRNYIESLKLLSSWIF